MLPRLVSLDYSFYNHFLVEKNKQLKELNFILKIIYYAYWAISDDSSIGISAGYKTARWSIFHNELVSL